MVVKPFSGITGGVVNGRIQSGLARNAAAPVKGAGVGREFEFTTVDFERVRTLIHRYAGIALTPAKSDMVYSRLAKRLRATGLKSFADYLDLMEKGGSGNPEREAFVNSMTTNLTSFFREAHHFPILVTHFLKRQGKGPFRVWCCASSTGEEPYSIAIALAEAMAGRSIPVSILATDVDTSVLATATAGVYSAERLASLSAERKRKFFEVSSVEGAFSVRPELRRMIDFKRLNLLDSGWIARGSFDVVFCRNVMIYFDKATQYKVLSRFVPLMQKDGLLIAGHSESFLHAADLFRPLGKTVYELVR